MDSNQKVKAPIIGADGNVFNLIGICNRELKSHGYAKEAEELASRVMNSGSYDEALQIMSEYVEPVHVGYDYYEDFDDDISI